MREKERERKWNVRRFWTDKDKENGFILASSLSEIKKVSCNYRVVISLNFILCIYLFNSKQKWMHCECTYNVCLTKSNLWYCCWAQTSEYSELQTYTNYKLEFFGATFIWIICIFKNTKRETVFKNSYAICLPGIQYTHNISCSTIVFF